jgi:hypothetical protein
MSFPTQDDYNRLSTLHGQKFDLAREALDVAKRTLDKAEAFAKSGKPLPPDEIAAMTARIADIDLRLYGPGRPVPPHRSGGGGFPQSSGRDGQ